jgi:hypothetical protein
MIGVDLQIISPASKRAADVLGVPFDLTVVDDLHRVLAGEIGLRLAALGVDRIGLQIGGDVAVEQIELEVDEDRFFAGHLEAKPVEPRSPFTRVFEIVDVIGRAIHNAPEP